MPTVEQYLKACAAHEGTVESPSGSNCNPFSKQLGRPCEAWCADAVAAIAKEVGLILPSFSAYTPTMADGFRTAGRWSHTPFPGYIAFMDFPDHTTGIQHVGVVSGVLDDGYNRHWEGNTSSGERGSQDNGGGFYSKKRPHSVIVGYGMPAYTDQPLVLGPGARVVKDEELELGKAAVRQQGGYIVIAHDGGVFAEKGAPYFGSIPEHPEWNVGGNVVSGLWTPSGNGYWIFTRDGAVYTFGDAVHRGAFNALVPGQRGNRYIIDAIPAGNGYSQIAFDPSNDGSPYDEYTFAA